jgi:hypothetical protein
MQSPAPPLGVPALPQPALGAQQQAPALPQPALGAQAPLPPAVAPPALGAQQQALAVAPFGVANILDVLCSGYHFTLGPLIDFPAIGRKLIRVKYTAGLTENYFFVYLSQSEGMFRVLFVLDPSGSIEKGVDYVQATLEEICLQYHLNKLYNELLKLIPTMIKSARDLIYFIKHMSEIDPYQYIKIHPGFNPVFQKVHSDYSSAGLNYPLMCYFTTVGVHYGSGGDKVNSFSDIVSNKDGARQKLVFLQNGNVIKNAAGNNRIPPVIEILTGAYLEEADYELCAKYKRELMSFDTNVTSLSEKDPTEMYAHVPLDTVGWNLGAMTTNMRLRSRLLPDNLELLALYVIRFLNQCLPMCNSFTSVAINENFRSTMLTLLKKLTLPSWVSPPSDLFTMTNDRFQQTLDNVKQQPQVLLSDILNFLYPIRKKLKTYIELVSKLTCKDLDELEKYSEFIKYLKTFINPMDVFNNDEKLKMLLETDYYINSPDDKILEWIKQWAELYADYTTRNVANELLQRVLKEKNLTYGNSKIDLLDQLIKTDMFDPNNNTNFDNTTTCQLIFLIGSVIIIFQDKIKFELGLTGSTGYLDAYKSTLSKFLLDESLLSFLSELSSPVPIVGGAKRGIKDLESVLPTKQRVTVNVKLPPILESIKRKRNELVMEISSDSDFNSKIAEYVVDRIGKEEEEDEFKKKLESFLVIPPDGIPRQVTDELYQEVKKFQNYASNKYYTMSMFDLHYGIDSNPKLQLYCYGTSTETTQFYPLSSSKISEFPEGFLPEQFKTRFDNWYFDVPLSGGNLPHNATIFTISVIYALEIMYETVEQEDLDEDEKEKDLRKSQSLEDMNGNMNGGVTEKKICILFTVSSTIVLPLPIPLTITESDIKFAILNQLTPIACIPYDDNAADINTIEKTLLGTYPRFSIYGTTFAGKPMDYVVGRHAQVPPYFKTDAFFSKYLKVCEHYCTTAPFYNWCIHKPYSGLTIDEGLPFASYFVELFSPGGDYASLNVQFEFDEEKLKNILKGRTSMIEKITRLFTLNCKFFEIYNSQDQEDEDEIFCKNAREEDQKCVGQVRPPMGQVRPPKRKRSTAASAAPAPPPAASAAPAPPPPASAAPAPPPPASEVATNPPAATNPAVDVATNPPAATDTEAMSRDGGGGSTNRQRQTLKRRQQGGNRTFKRHLRDKYKRKHNDDGLTKHKTSNKLRRKKSVKN